jgi:hypothetical protein
LAVDRLATLAVVWRKASGITSSSSGVEGAYARVSRCTRAVSLRLNELWSRKCDLVTKLIVLLTFIIAALALWPTFSALREGRKATTLAQWTAKKDYFEFCESVSPF